MKILFVVSKSTGYFALKSFLEHNEFSSETACVLTLDDRDDKRSCFSQIVSMCEQHEVSCYIAFDKLAIDRALETFLAEIVFVCGWYWIIEESTRAKVKHGFLGVHNSLLPKYRGMAPLVWSMINGDENVGSTLFKIDEGVDNGVVYHQWKVKRDNKKTGSVLQLLDEMIYDSFGPILSEILNGNNQGKQQCESEASYCGKRTPADGFINWKSPSHKILLFINALSSPYPNAFTFVNQKKINIVDAELFKPEIHGIPGQVIIRTPSTLVVCCGCNTGLSITKAFDQNGETDLLKLFPSMSSVTKEPKG